MSDPAADSDREFSKTRQALNAALRDRSWPFARWCERVINARTAVADAYAAALGTHQYEHQGVAYWALIDAEQHHRAEADRLRQRLAEVEGRQ